MAQRHTPCQAVPVELTSFFSFQEIQVELAIIVGSCSLFRMAQTCGYGYRPNDPLVFLKEHAGTVFTEAYSQIDRHKPEVAAQTVEYTTEA